MADRQTFNLLSKWGWRNCIDRKFDSWARQHILKDTFIGLKRLV